jgi:hypothetical protein
LHAFTVNYKERDRRSALVDLGFFLHSVPRPLVLCRLFRHRPVVDGTKGYRDDPGYRWVVCDRCGVRPDPQGRLDPAVWNIGQRYTGSWSEALPENWREQAKALGGLNLAEHYPPGPWSAEATGALGGQVVIGPRGGSSVGFEVKIGNKGSEHTLAAQVQLGRLGALYLHTERFGEWLVRRLNPTGYHSKVTGLTIHDGYLWWRLWADRDAGWSSNAPWYRRVRDGSVRIDPRDHVLGPRRYSYEDVGDPVTALVRMPHGDDHEVTLKLQRCTFGRKRGRKRMSWSVDWDCRPGIPTKPGDRGRVMGSGVDVPDASVDAGTWPVEACAAIAVRMTTDRRRYGWRSEFAAGTACG